MQNSLQYHAEGRPGKIEVISSKPCRSSEELSLAYSPGVAEPVLEISKNPSDVYKYTSKGNLVGVISNGTAILGLGSLGALASKPVMEGKGILFKRFADIDVFDIEIDETDPKKLIEIIKSLEPTFGGINLEDIKSPECFEIEQTLIKECSIPVFHDDQHGTAVIALAGLLNALEIAQKDIAKVKVVYNGAGAAGISCAKMFLLAGVSLENLYMCDINGLLVKDREKELFEEQKQFMKECPEANLAEVIKGADVFVGVSAADCVSPEMLKSMNDNPIVFAMANPNPEITYDLAKKTRSDIIMATGRSDYPNQVNNVLGFPYIFRGALDVGAPYISEGMKMAAAKALAALTKAPFTDELKKNYGGDVVFGKDYIIPKPFDSRIIEWVSSAVAEAACKENLASRPREDWDQYRLELRKRMEKYWA